MVCLSGNCARCGQPILDGSCGSGCGEILSQEEKIERLKASNRMFKFENNSLRAEIKRLTEALNAIADPGFEIIGVKDFAAATIGLPQRSDDA